MKLGSLFDGSGGFPLAGSLCGIEPVWASEVEPYPIAVTKSRFPNMKHLGSVTDVHGGDIEPVDIITFGIPCQDLSVAGKRAGLKHEANGDEETTRSGLFMEAVRIIKEMREATNGEYPTFAVWENVPGAFSSNKGEDFRTVLEELIKIVEPTAVMPAVPKNGWPYADSYCGDGWSLAYRVFDAQYWGVPQRRRRIYLVLDLRGQRAGKVSFEREGLRGNFATFKTAGKGTAGDAADCTGADDCDGKCVAYSFDSLASNRMKSKNPHSGCRRVEIAKTLDTTDPNPSKNHGGISIVEQHLMDAYQHQGWRESNVCGTLTAGQNNTVRGDTPLVCNAYTLKIRSGCEGGVKGDREDDYQRKCDGLPLGFRPENIRIYEETATTICNGTRPGFCNGLIVSYDAIGNGDGQTVSTLTGDHENRITDYTSVVCMAHGQANAEILEDKSPCLNCNHEQPIVFDKEVYNSGVNATGGHYIAEGGPSPTLRTSVPPGVCVQCIVRRLTPTECARLQGFPDDWGHPDHKEDFTDEEYRFWLNVRNTHAAINGKPQKDYTKDQMLAWYNKLHTDSSEYKMWGNGISLPTALYVMQGIAEECK